MPVAAKKKAASKKKTASKKKVTKRAAPSVARNPNVAYKKKSPPAGPAVPPAGGGAAVSPAATTSAASAGNVSGPLRVRMYRIGFGDFFLLTVPSPAGAQHILIDCGVHAANIGSMNACVQDLMQVTGRKFALVIATHYHADHLSGFASNYAAFAQCEVGAVWITNRLDPSDSGAMKFQAQIAALANRLSLQLAASQDLEGRQAFDKVQNALGVAGGSNVKALQLLTQGFKNKPPVYYYQAGDSPQLPPALQGVLTAQVLGPSPKSSGGTYSATDNRTEQYLAAAGDAAAAADAPASNSALDPFKKWPDGMANYSVSAFREYRTAAQIKAKQHGTPSQLAKVLRDAQPDALAATADALDGTLNNQSLVVLFTCRGKRLLFVGDAQWGNWEYWLYGKPVAGQNPGITPTAKEILNSIDFYKVGHHGSTNATPIPAVQALSEKCVAMCSTETGYPSLKRTYGNPEKGTEVPRTKLMDALEKKLGMKLVRSDWIKVNDAPASPEAHQELEKLPPNFTAGPLYIDYTFPV
jgi:beta-lactamase superfamily II metal-dependent hydrolase